MYDDTALFAAFEFSAQIVAGTRICRGLASPPLLFDEPMRMGKRIAMGMRLAEGAGRLDETTI